MERVVLYHNPACSKSRGAKAILEALDVDVDIVEYSKTPFGEAELRRILDLVDDLPTELVRRDANFSMLGLNAGDYTTEDAVVDLVLRHPGLMQRPVAVRGERAVIARPSERVEELL